MSKLIILDIELNAIKSFIETVKTASNNECLCIKKRSDEGEFSDFEDEDNAFFIPTSWEKIASRAVFCELNALVEWELQLLSSEPFHGKNSGTYNKKSMILFDQKVSDTKKLIEKHYQIQINQIDHYTFIENIRNKANSFKHRKGFKHPVKDNCKCIPEINEVNYEEALQSIVSVRRFLKDLWDKTTGNKM